MDYDPNDPQAAADAQAKRAQQQQQLNGALTGAPTGQQQPGVNFFQGQPQQGAPMGADGTMSGIPQVQPPGSPQIFPIKQPIQGGGGGGGLSGIMSMFA